MPMQEIACWGASNHRLSGASHDIGLSPAATYCQASARWPTGPMLAATKDELIQLGHELADPI
jgi:hypothetical protein